MRVGGAIRRYDKKGVYAIKTDTATATAVTALVLDDTSIDIAKDGTQEAMQKCCRGENQLWRQPKRQFRRSQ